MSRFPPNRATRARLSRIEAVRTAAERAGEPLLRFRKVNGILSALAMQIEDAGDDPEVVAHLLDALAAAVRAHVSEPAAADVLQAVEALRKAEAQRRPWRQSKGLHSPNGIKGHTSLRRKAGGKALTFYPMEGLSWSRQGAKEGA